MPQQGQRFAGRVEHALAFSDTAITLWRRAHGGGLSPLFGARLDAEDFLERVRALPQRAGLRPGRPLEVVLWLPPEHVVSEPAPAGAVAEIALALAMRTGRDPASLSVCLAEDGEAGRLAFAADQSTVDEAVAYARGWGFAPVAVSVPPDQAPDGVVVALPAKGLVIRRRAPLALAAGLAGAAVLGGVAASLWLAEPGREVVVSPPVPAVAAVDQGPMVRPPSAVAVPDTLAAMESRSAPGAVESQPADMQRARPGVPDQPTGVVRVSAPEVSEPGLRAGIVVASLGPLDIGLAESAFREIEAVATLPVVPAPMTVPQRPIGDSPPVAEALSDTPPAGSDMAARSDTPGRSDTSARSDTSEGDPLPEGDATADASADPDETVAGLAPMPAVLPPPRPGMEPAEADLAALAETASLGADGEADMGGVAEAETVAVDVAAIAAPAPSLRTLAPTVRPDRPEPALRLAAPRPGTRPVRRPAVAVAAAPAQPSPTTPASLAQAATLRGALPPGETGLLGVIGSGGTRSALLRTSDGRVQKVERGDRVDGWTVSAIDATSVRLQGNGGTRTLRVPSR